MRALYHIESELNNINEQLIESGGELSPELQDKLAMTREELATKAANYGFVILKNQSEAAIIDAEIKRLKAIKGSLDNATDKIKEAISNAMIQYDLTEVKTPTIKLSFRASESVEVDESKLAQKYWNYKPTVDKTTIKADLKAGIEVDGARIVSKQNLQVK